MLKDGSGQQFTIRGSAIQLRFGFLPEAPSGSRGRAGDDDVHVRRSYELRCLAFPKTLQLTQKARLSAALTSWKGVLEEG